MTSETGSSRLNVPLITEVSVADLISVFPSEGRGTASCVAGTTVILTVGV